VAMSLMYRNPGTFCGAPDLGECMIIGGKQFVHAAAESLAAAILKTYKA
jgi:hypothetical protein